MSYSESVIKSFFTNDLEVSEYDYRPTYTLFRVKAVDGVPVHAKILLSFYNEKEYCPAHTRENYQGSLNVFIKGNLFEGCDTEQCIGSRSVPFSKNSLQTVPLWTLRSSFSRPAGNISIGTTRSAVA